MSFRKEHLSNYRMLKNLAHFFLKEWAYWLSQSMLLLRAYDPRTDDHSKNSFHVSWCIERIAHKKPNAFFLQIGAHDGVGLDPIHHSEAALNWRGILVEPVEEQYRRLIANKSERRGLIFENVAISDTDGEKVFYTMNPDIVESHPFWSSMLSSFNRETITWHKFLVPDIEVYIEERIVKCLTFDSLLAKYHVDEVDVIIIDTEGYDFEILIQIDFEHLRPQVVIYENKHLSDDQSKDAVLLLQKAGYKIQYLGEDCVATCW